MIYSLSLEKALLIAGLALVIFNAVALVKRRAVQSWLQAFPRSKEAGTILLLIAAIWSWLLIRHMDLGEFTHWRSRILVIIPIVAVLTWLYVDEFLAVRALGMVSLLTAEPLLEAAWLRPEATRLLLVTPVYLWIVFAIFWIGMPYTLRDQIQWLLRSESRWRYATIAGLAYGLLLLILPMTLRHSA